MKKKETPFVCLSPDSLLVADRRERSLFSLAVDQTVKLRLGKTRQRGAQLISPLAEAEAKMVEGWRRFNE